MKRSQINKAIKDALALLEASSIKLPMFGYWTVDDWASHACETDNIRAIMLGWDVTDFGGGNFGATGATLFTLRNGCHDDASRGTPYAEKLIILQHETEQEIPFHFHANKTEDIINRVGGVLTLELYNSMPGGDLDKTTGITVKMDGIIKTFPAGVIVEVEPGCSITLTPGIYHRFWAKKGCGDLIVGEVSSINDDRTDNHFLKEQKRFTQIEEDEPAIWPLCNELYKFDED